MVTTPRKGARTRPSHPPKTVDEYIARAPQAARRKLKEFRAIIRSVVPPDASELISYGIPAFGQKKILVWYAVFSNHCSLFPTASVVARFKDELKSYSKSKGTIQFAIDEPLPASLIRKIVRTRIQQAAQGKTGSTPKSGRERRALGGHRAPSKTTPKFVVDHP